MSKAEMQMGLVKHIKNLVKGLGITGKHLGRHAVTIQYPEERWQMPERSRGIVVLLSDKETGELNCTACELCAKACPTAAITIESHRDENKRKVLDKFVVDNGLCCFCGMCEEACNFSAIKMATKYEFSVLDKKDLIWDKDKLQQVGRDVPYEDTRKKKKVGDEGKPTPKAAVKAVKAPAQAAVPNPGGASAASDATQEKPPASKTVEPLNDSSGEKQDDGSAAGGEA